MKTPPSTPVDPTLQTSSKGNAAGFSSRKQASGITPSSSDVRAATPATSSYLSRKAHRFSTLKRQKKPSGLIQHLFGGASQDDDNENARDPAPADSHDDDDDEEDVSTGETTGGGCMSFALTEAISSLRLDQEEDVRRTIQRNMVEVQESMLDAKSLVMEVVCNTLEPAAPGVVTNGRDGSKSPLLPPLQHPKYALASFSSESKGKESPNKSPKGSNFQGEGDAIDLGRKTATTPRHNQVSLLLSNEPSDENGEAQELHQVSGSWDNAAPPPRAAPDPPTENQTERNVESIADALKRVFLASSSPSSPSPTPSSSKKTTPFPSASPTAAVSTPSASPKARGSTVLPSNNSMPHPASTMAVPPIQTVATSPATFLAPVVGNTVASDAADDEDFLPDDFLVGGNVAKDSPDNYKNDLMLQLRIDQAVATARVDWEAEQERRFKEREESLRDEHERDFMALHLQVQELKQEKLDLVAEHEAVLQQRVQEEVAKAKRQWEQEMMEKQALSLQQRVIKEVELAKQQWDREHAVRQRTLNDEVEIAKKQWELEMMDKPATWIQERIQAEVEAAKHQWEADSAAKQQEFLRQHVETARQQWEHEFLAQQEQRIQKEVELAILESKSQELTAKEELESEIHQLQRKINEQKDQTLMAKQLAKQHQAEMEQMEAKLAELSHKSDQVSKLQQQVVDLQRERDEMLANMAQEVEDAKKQNEKELALLQTKLVEKSQELEQATQSKAQLEKDREQQVAHIRKMQGVLGRALSPSKGTPSPSSRGGATSPASRGSSTPNTSVKNSSVSSPTTEIKLSQSREEVTKLKLIVEELKLSKKALEDKLQQEIETLQLQMTEAKVMDAVEIESLKMQYESALESKERELESSKQELRSLRDQLGQLKNSDSVKPDQQALFQSKLESMEREKSDEVEALTRQLAEVRQQLAAKDCELSSATRSPPRSGTIEPLSKAKQELASLRREMDQLKKTKDAEIIELQRLIKSLTERLNEKRVVDESPAKRVGTPGRSTPSRIPVRGGRRESGGSDALERDLHEREKEVLRQHVIVLEEQVRRMSSEHEQALEELRKRSESELARIKKEMENRIEKHMQAERDLKETLATVDSMDKEELLERIERLESEKKADRSGGLREVQKKEELLQRIIVLEKREKELLKEQEAAMQEVRDQTEIEIRRLQKEIEKQRHDSLEKERALERAISETESFEKEELLQRVDKLESQLESERNGAVLVKMKVACLEKEAKAAEKAHHQELEALRTALESECKSLEDTTRKLSALEDCLKTVENERNTFQEQAQALTTKLNMLRQEHQDEIDTLRGRHSDELDRHRRNAAEQMVKVERDAKSKILPLQQELEQLRKFKDQAEQIKGLSPQDEESLRKDLADSEARLNLETKKFEKTLASMERECSEQLELMQQTFNAKIVQMEEEHQKDNEGLLSKLAKAESEHRTKLSELQKSTSEKDAIITALGSQLAEAHARAKKGDENVRSLTDKLEQTRKEVTQAYGEIGKLKLELQSLTEKHNAFIAEAETAKEEACEEARDEMIERAEIQFKQANELYVKLKKQYDICKKKVASLDSELKKTKQALREHESTTTDYKAQVTSLKEENSKIEDEGARKGKEYRKEMERLLQAAEDFEKKYKAAEHTSRHAYKKLAAVNAEKEKLQKECDEVKSVCEELMAMVEGRHQHHEC